MEAWDKNVPPSAHWKSILEALKPGSFCLSFCSPQLYHRLACNMEDAGFIIRDMVAWITSTKMVKTNRLKPFFEPICVAQKPYEGTLEENVANWGVGKIDIEEVRQPWENGPPKGWVKGGLSRRTFGKVGKTKGTTAEFGKEDANPAGRYPANVVGQLEPQKYFYSPRATREEKGDDNDHPTVKPIDLMEWLIKIYVPKGGEVLDPFMGSGTTGVAAIRVNRRFYGIELDPHYHEIAEKRLSTKVPMSRFFKNK